MKPDSEQERARKAAIEFLSMTDDERLWAYNIWRSSQHPDLKAETPHYRDTEQLAALREHNQRNGQ